MIRFYFIVLITFFLFAFNNQASWTFFYKISFEDLNLSEHCELYIHRCPEISKNIDIDDNNKFQLEYYGGAAIEVTWLRLVKDQTEIIMKLPTYKNIEIIGFKMESGYYDFTNLGIINKTDLNKDTICISQPSQFVREKDFPANLDWQKVIF